MNPVVCVQDKDDGCFWMCFEDFCLHFDSVYVCRLFDAKDGWKTRQVSARSQ